MTYDGPRLGPVDPLNLKEGVGQYKMQDLRDRFAMAALPTFITKLINTQEEDLLATAAAMGATTVEDMAAGLAYTYADAMMRARERAGD